MSAPQRRSVKGGGARRGRPDAAAEGAGTLYLVATPIGNLDDITLRALEVMGRVDRVLAEDTRRTRKLLTHHGIRARLESYHEHNEREKTPTLVRRLRDGTDLALVTDAGTPSISDPGYRLVAAAVDAGLRVVPIPGASSILAALTASGLPTHRFTFLGYLPRKEGERRGLLQRVRRHEGTLVFLEAPRRLRRSLRDAAEILGDRDAAVARELTKVHEEFIRGPLDELAERLGEVRGEVTVCVAGHPEPGPVPGSPADARLQLSLSDHYTALRRAGVPRNEALRQVARERDLPRREVYRKLMIDDESANGPEDDR